MPTFDYTFIVKASLEAVSNFHHSTEVLKTLTPPPVFVRLHRFEPLGEGSLAEFTMWFGPLPLRYKVVHNDVSRNGFTDTQLEGPLRRWQHSHRFEEIAPHLTRVHEYIEYDYKGGWRGLFSRLLFGRLGLTLLFTARKLITRRHLERQATV